MSYIGHLPEIGAGIIGRGVTDTLYVCPNGANSNGRTWGGAFTTINAALDAASVDPDDATLIMISPHDTYYNIDTAGDPTWAGNYILKGTHRTWAKIKNTNVGATSIMKLTGRASLMDLNFNLGANNPNGIIMTMGAGRVYSCQFVGEDLTAAATALHFDGATLLKHHKVIDCNFRGHKTHMTGLLIDKSCCSDHEKLVFHDCKTAIQLVDSDSEANVFRDIDIGGCALGLDIDAGSEQHFFGISFHDNDVDVDDEVKDHLWQSIFGQFPTTMEPEDLAGVEIAAGDEDWGADTEIRAAISATVPFKVLAYTVQPSSDENTLIRFSADSGLTFFDEGIFASKKNKAAAGSDATDFIFNAGTRISASVWSPGAGRTVDVWLEIQEI